MSSYRPSNDNRRGGRRAGRNQRPYAGLPPRPTGPPPTHPPPPGVDNWRRENRGPPSPPRHQYDSYRGPDNRREPPPASYDNYRPPQGDFTFRMSGPAGLGNADSYRPGQPGQGRRGNYGQGRGRGSRGRGNFYQRTIPAERELLRQHGQVREDLVDGENATTYRDIDDLSDDEEAAMDISDRSDGENGEPANKRARHAGASTEAAQSAPKWSNPDAETALPPEENQRKKKDVVKLIRKARMDDNSAAKLAASTEAEDFISFDFGDDQEAETVDDAAAELAPNSVSVDERKVEDPPSSKAPVFPDAPKGPARDIRRPAPPEPRGPAGPARGSDPLGSRKRTIDDEIKPPSYGPLKKNIKTPARGKIVVDWVVKPDEEPCPWLVKDHSKTSEMSVWLHKEIVDFYEHVRPRTFEERMRSELVDKLHLALQRNPKYRGFEVRPFGSFMSGLYLPTADMDLVICSKSWLAGGMSAFPSASSLHRFRGFLASNGLAAPNSIEVIAKARVPLVKYIDASTGLRVDISFDKMDGPAAIRTFLRWKDEYPALPALVTIIKHFLAMRGLNEPVNGGIGSFSVSCMVLSMLQLMPQVQSRNLVPEHHLGEMLMEFLDLYGNRFDYMNTAIRVNPPGYVAKSSKAHNLTYKNRDRLSIIDPNNSSNDIAGGSSNTDTILFEFHAAHRLIKQRMADLAQEDGHASYNPSSILEIILAGDYSSFRLQRGHLRRLHEKSIGPCQDRE